MAGGAIRLLGAPDALLKGDGRMRLTLPCRQQQADAQAHCATSISQSGAGSAGLRCVRNLWRLQRRGSAQLQAQHLQDMCRHGCSAQAWSGAATQEGSRLAAGSLELTSGATTGEAISEPPSSRSLIAAGDVGTGLTAAPCSLRFTTALLPAPAAAEVRRGSDGGDTQAVWQQPGSLSCACPASTC